MVIVDVHTHIYPQSYVDTLRSRQHRPRVVPDGTGKSERLIILESEERDQGINRGRPIGPDYYDIDVKIAFMDTHGIDKSVISIANPWLDWETPEAAIQLSQHMNDELEGICQASHGRLYAFGILPTSASVEYWIEALDQIQRLPHLKGVIMGTKGLGHGLDDPALDVFYRKLGNTGLFAFVHPHYGIPPEEYGDRPNGHVMALALGFPFETTIAITRLVLSGIYDRVPSLKLLIAHAGACLPALSGRLDSCVQHDPIVASRLKKQPSDYLRMMWFDAIGYSPASLKCAAELLGQEAPKRLLFGTDNPFFPPLDGGKMWHSVQSNVESIKHVFNSEEERGIMGNNAIDLFGLA